MALAERTSLHLLDHLVRQVEQADQVADRDTAATDATPHLLAREPQLLDERRARAGLLDRAEVLAGHVLDERELERNGVLALADERRNALETGDARRAPAALAGDELIGAPGARPDEHGLQDSALAQRPRERVQRLLVELAPGLTGARHDQLERKVAELLLGDRRALGRGRQDRAQAPSHSGSRLSHGQPPPWRARSTLPHPRCADRGGSRADRSSAPPPRARFAG